jgi:crotonobetainyl-CoA:carnitine CoA-transferase CaiB-like acyl-CoA transferase
VKAEGVGEEQMTTGPLSALKVLEIAGIGSGPFSGMLLADLGADVVTARVAAARS